MLKNDIEKTLEAHKPQTPAGFAERSDAQVLQLFAEGKKKGSLKRKFTVVLCGLLLMLSLTTALAATVPVVNATLYKYWPQAAEALMPINASCVDQGIKMEVESAVVKDKQALITYSLQDLEGDRINKYTDAWVDRLLFTEPVNGEKTLNLNLGYNEAEKKATFATGVEYFYLRDKVDEEPLTIKFSMLIPNEMTDLRPLLKEYGNAPETMVPPQNSTASRADSKSIDGFQQLDPQMLEVLDPSKGPNLEINEYLRLTGIGWVDGKLHVQLYYPDIHMQPIGSSTTDEYFPVDAWVTIPTPLNYDISDGHGLVKAATEVRWWSEKPDNFMEYVEYIIECDPAELEQTDFLLETRRYDRVIEGNWEVTVPYRMIKFE